MSSGLPYKRTGVLVGNFEKKNLRYAKILLSECGLNFFTPKRYEILEQNIISRHNFFWLNVLKDILYHSKGSHYASVEAEHHMRQQNCKRPPGVIHVNDTAFMYQ